MKVRKDITIEYDTLIQYQKVVDNDPKLLGNFSGGVEKLINRELMQKKEEASHYERLPINVEFVPSLGSRQSLITEYDIKVFHEDMESALKQLSREGRKKIAIQCVAMARKANNLNGIKMK